MEYTRHPNPAHEQGPIKDALSLSATFDSKPLIISNHHCFSSYLPIYISDAHFLRELSSKGVAKAKVSITDDLQRSATS